MNRLLLDTSAIIGLIERRVESLRTIVAADDAVLHMSIVTLGELEHGVAAATTTTIAATRRSSLHAVIDATDVVGLDADDASTYGLLSHELRRRGWGPRAVGTADRWIAATAITRGLTLVTQDRLLAEAIDAVTDDHLVLLAE